MKKKLSKINVVAWAAGIPALFFVMIWSLKWLYERGKINFFWFLLFIIVGLMSSLIRLVMLAKASTKEDE